MVEINGKKICENCFEELDGPFCTHCGYPSTGIADPIMLYPGSALLGKYVVGKVMGKGGFGVTYLAYDVTAGRKVAIKEFFPYGVALRTAGTTTVSVASMDNAEAFKLGAEKFYNEAKLVAKFNGNPNIVGVYEFFYENDTVYFAMEYLKGHTLKEHIQKHGVLTPAQALFVAQNVANALMAAHSSNVLHRDISPDNIIICDNGDVKLIDFGAARQVVAEHSQSFSVILKPGFAPLEQYQKKGNQGPWTDIYSLGATVYYALTEDIPEDPMSRLDDDEEFSSNKYNIDPELWGIISKATELKIDDRYGDIFEFKNDLAKISVEAEPLVAPKEQTAEKMPEFHTAMPYGMTQTTASQPVKQPVGVGAPAPAFSPTGNGAPIGNPGAVNAQQFAPNGTDAPAKKKPKGKIIAICSAAAVAVAAAIIIPIAVSSNKDREGHVSPGYSTPSSQTVKTETVTDREYTYTNSNGKTVTLTYTGEWSNNAPNGQGKGVYESGDVYEGEWKDGKWNGQGKHTWDTDDGTAVFVGEFKDGKANGQGKRTNYDANGKVTSIFEGEYKDSTPNGQGKRTNYDANGKVTSIYEGEWKDGKKNGQGKMTWANGDVYEGEWKDGKYNGQGTYTWADGRVYVGEWKDDKRNGQGTYTWTDGYVYVGEWKDDVRNGYGKYIDNNGKVIHEGQWKDDKFVGETVTTVTNKKYGSCTYTGEWSNNAPNGQGKGVYESGDVYEGEWKDGKINGQGKCTFASGNVYEGEWKDGKFNGQGKYTYSTGDVYVGKLKDGKFNGQGKMTYASGNVYEGEWKDGKKNGHGKYTYTNGDVFEGEWKNGEKNGQGKYTWANGSVREGVWKDDKFVG